MNCLKKQVVARASDTSKTSNIPIENSLGTKPTGFLSCDCVVIMDALCSGNR